MTDNEAWYDAEIAPALAALATRCHERGMAFLATVEYQPGELGDTRYMTKDAGLAMQMLALCQATAPNVDRYVIALRRYCRDRGIDTSTSAVLDPYPRLAAEPPR